MQVRSAAGSSSPVVSTLGRITSALTHTLPAAVDSMLPDNTIPVNAHHFPSSTINSVDAAQVMILNETAHGSPQSDSLQVGTHGPPAVAAMQSSCAARSGSGSGCAVNW